VHVELYTRMLPKGTPASFVQLGHLLTEEDRIKHHLLLLLFAAGIITTTVSGSMSWWLTGRSLRSTKQLWEQQQTFVANASHELRTPLTLIRTTAQMLQLNMDQADVQRELLKDVLGETDYMTKLVDNMLVLARLDAGQLQLELAPLDLSEVLPQVAHPFATLAKEQGVALRVAGAEGIVLADRTRFWQVLLILLDNSLRHTPSGGCITLESTVCDGRVIVTVTDTGRGILSDDLPHVFERFYKASKSRGDKRSAGLGLSIAKPLVELQNGEINIHSIPGVRTIATIELPAYAVEAI
jgi:signal transduction histidine kinase